jgi:ribosomal protein S18 acetylase RimI-like enzyme
MQTRIRTALPDDLSSVRDLMQGYYRDDGLEFSQVQLSAMLRLLQEPQWGRVYLLEVGELAAGYLAVCFGFSLELGGNDAFVDEVFVLPEQRGRGYGTQLLEFAAADCATLGVRALHLEVDRGNEGAQRLYDSLGYLRRDRYYTMTKPLSAR